MPSLAVVPEGISIRLRDGESILEGLFRSGYAYRVGCRRGGCAICMVDLVDGEVTPVIMIETAEALDNLEEILQVPGVDAVYVGPFDLSLALGLPPASHHDDARFTTREALHEYLS